MCVGVEGGNKEAAALSVSSGSSEVTSLRATK